MVITLFKKFVHDLMDEKFIPQTYVMLILLTLKIICHLVPECSYVLKELLVAEKLVLVAEKFIFKSALPIVLMKKQKKFVIIKDKILNQNVMVITMANKFGLEFASNDI